MSAAIALYKAVRQEYDYDADIFCPDAPKVKRVKQIISHLNDADRTIIQLYAELASLRELGKLLGISRASAHKEVTRIRKAILEEYNNGLS